MSASHKYLLDQTVTHEGSFAVAGVPTDPTTVTLTIISPDRVAHEYTYAAGQIQRISAGVYRRDELGDQLGTWFYEWVGTGACAASYQDYYRIVDYLS